VTTAPAGLRTQLNRAALVDLPRLGAPCAIVIFGASGDLAHRKLVPALYNLAAQSLLDERSHIIGVARRAASDDSFRQEMEAAVREHARLDFDARVWARVSERLHYVRGDFQDLETYRRLAGTLEQLKSGSAAVRHRLFYLATPPASFGAIVFGLEECGLARPDNRDDFIRIIVEKPFGEDLHSARELNREIARAFSEEQIFRIDHYLGKETVQNVLVFRLGNGIFEPLWNRRYVDHVQITAAESIGVEGRGGYFDRAGIARDMLQSHLLQLLTLVAMEPPIAFEPRAVHDEKVKVLRAIRTHDAETFRRHSVRAQYTQGAVAGVGVPGYLDESGIRKSSDTETYVAVRLELDNWRWAGVPFFLRAGKRMPKRATEIAIVFKRPPLSLFENTGVALLDATVLAIRIQPDEGISLKFVSKVPGHDFHVDPVQMDFLYSRAFGIEPPEAYERLLLDAIAGDSTLFARIDEVELGWRYTDAMRGSWYEGAPSELGHYEAGTWGPEAADLLMEREGRKWRRL
jgi:glucose-6-phosphate 1-dehydrogenase